MAAFARQLGGVSTIGPAAGGGALVELTVPLQPMIENDIASLAADQLAPLESVSVAESVERV
jgi:hypothetical protein